MVTAIRINEWTGYSPLSDQPKTPVADPYKLAEQKQGYPFADKSTGWVKDQYGLATATKETLYTGIGPSPDIYPVAGTPLERGSGRYSASGLSASELNALYKGREVGRTMKPLPPPAKTAAELEEEENLAWVGQERASDKTTWLLGNNWSIGGISMNKANYDNFWRLYNGVIKNGGSKGEAFRYAANDFNSRRTAGQGLITLMVVAGTAGFASTLGAGVPLLAGSGAAETAITQGTMRGANLSGMGLKAVVSKVAKVAGKQAGHSIAFATAGQLGYGFISKFTNEWVPYYGKYQDWRKSG